MNICSWSVTSSLKKKKKISWYSIIFFLRQQCLTKSTNQLEHGTVNNSDDDLAAFLQTISIKAQRIEVPIHVRHPMSSVAHLPPGWLHRDSTPLAGDSVILFNGRGCRRLAHGPAVDAATRPPYLSRLLANCATAIGGDTLCDRT